MNRYHDLLRRIAEEYSIRRGDGEEESAWTVRIIYSYLGQVALASLFDRPEEEEVSIVHVKRRIVKVLDSYRLMYPELRYLIPDHATNKERDISEEIYDIYLNTGCIYHREDHVMMATKSECVVEGICFTRGHAIGEKKRLSGLGSYKLVNEQDSSSGLPEMFQLEQIPLSEIWNICVENAVFHPFSIESSSMQFLRMEPPFNRRYWIEKPEKSGNIGLMRTDNKGKHAYYLYHYNGNSLNASQLPDWQVQDYQYRVLANACLQKNGVLPPARFRSMGEIVSLSFNYLPPPAELNLWKLYSWPENCLSFPRDFNRICEHRVFEAIRETLEVLGYQFEEVKE